MDTTKPSVATQLEAFFLSPPLMFCREHHADIIVLITTHEQTQYDKLAGTVYTSYNDNGINCDVC